MRQKKKKKGTQIKLYENRGTYMSAPVLFNFIKQVGEKDKIWGCDEHLISFPQ